VQIYDFIMKTKDIKVNNQYLFNNEVVTVIKRIPGKETKKRIMHSGLLFEGYIKTKKKFLLDNGKEVYANNLYPIIS